ncbi:hypothetical protein [Alkalibacter mobilis]|uniref:hypothetical protein n=1 Tax=Alkalibacter mobilis TaxID=2787712 RepID=UPI00189DC300|nr:hypothetical protein [Alkalibacter mobilis]MBF7097860.1 hypothetical protein [Alkalibacter mobilis]
MKVSSSKGTFFLIMVFSLVAGTFFGELLGEFIPVLARGFEISLFDRGTGSWLINFNFIKIDLGMIVKLNLGSFVFIILSFILFYKK